MFDYEFEQQKELQARQILKRGHATIKELLELNYGEWPLRGLDIIADDHLKNEVSLLPITRLIARIFSDKKTGIKDKLIDAKQLFYTSFIANNQAVVYPTSDKREIWYNINKLNYAFAMTGEATTNRMLAHERRHIQHFDPCNPQRAREMFGTGFLEENLTKNHQGAKFVHQAVTQMLREHMKDTSTISQAWDQISNEDESGTNKLSRLDRKKAYLQNGLELQTRMEELLCVGYPKWPHMPLSKQELWAAMIDMGLKPSAEVQEILDADPVFQEAKNCFSTNQKTFSSSFQLNWAIDNLPTQKAQTEFWLVTMPIIYGDILESFGDRQGRIRMGEEVNLSLPLLLFGKTYDACHAPVVDKRTYQEIADRSKIYGSLLSAQFIDCFYEIRPQDSQAKDLRIIDPAAAHFITAMVQAPGVADVLLQHSSSVMTWINKQTSLIPSEPSHAFVFATDKFQR